MLNFIRADTGPCPLAPLTLLVTCASATGRMDDHHSRDQIRSQSFGNFFQEPISSISDSQILAPLLSPHPPEIPPELINDPDYYKKFYIQFTFVNVVLVASVLLFALWVILMNILVIIGVLQKQRSHTTDYYLITLSVMDILVGFIVIPLMGTVVIVGYFPLGKVVCHAWVFMDYFLVAASALGYCVLMLNYLWMVRFPGAYRNYKKVHVIVITLIWLVPLLLWLPAFLNNLTFDFPNGVCGYYIPYNRYYSFSFGIIGFVLPLIVSVGCAIYSVVILRRKIHDRLFYVRPLKFDKTVSPISRKRLWSQGVIFETDHVLTSQARAKKHFPLVLILLGIFILCRITFYAYFGIGAFVAKIFPPDLSNGLYWMMHTNAGLSPFVHILFDPDLREAIRKTFCGKRQTQVQPIHNSATNNDNESVISTSDLITNRHI